MSETPWTPLRPDEFLSKEDDSELGRWAVGQGPEAPDRRLLRRIVEETQPQSFLEVGCGPGIELKGLANDGLLDIGYRGYDFTHRFIAYCKSQYPSLSFDVVDATGMEEVATADIVYSRHMLEHIEDGETALKNLCRAARKLVVVSWFIRPSWEDEKVEWVGRFVHHTYSAKKLIRIARQYGLLRRYDFDHHSVKASIWTITIGAEPGDRYDRLAHDIPYFMQTESFLTSCRPVPPDPQERLNALKDVLAEMVEGYDGVIEYAERVPGLLDVIAQTRSALVETYTIDPEIEQKVKHALRTVAARAESALGADPEEIWALVRQARDAQARGKSASD